MQGRGFDPEHFAIIDARIIAAFASVKLKDQANPSSASMGGDV